MSTNKSMPWKKPFSENNASYGIVDILITMKCLTKLPKSKSTDKKEQETYTVLKMFIYNWMSHLRISLLL